MSILTTRENGKTIAQTHCFLVCPRQIANYETMLLKKKKVQIFIPKAEILSISEASVLVVNVKLCTAKFKA